MNSDIEYSAYIFDFDYTLGDATNGIVICVNNALKNMNITQCSREDIQKTIGLTLSETFYKLTNIHEENLRNDFLKYFREKADIIMTDNTELFPDTIKTLSLLKDNDAKLGIVTTKFHYRIDEILRKYKIQQLIDIVIGAEDVKDAKPDPEGLLFAIKELNVPKENAVYIGDSIVDANTARNAGVAFIAVTTGVTPPESFMDFPCKRIINNLSELIKL